MDDKSVKPIMKNLFIILLLSITFISCVDNDVIRALSEAESNMQENPELSLKLLESIDSDELKTRKHTARHALLYSMALDKNYIDISSDSIIAPAVRYYRRHCDINDAIDLELHKSDIRLIEDRYIHHIDLLQQKHRGTIIITFLVLTCLLLGYWIVKWRKKLVVNYPDFISELRKSGLTSSEIGYCCLLLLGLNIPEAGKVIGRESSIYNVSSSIRKKINLSTCSSNLDKWLVRKFAEIYPIERC